MRKKDTSNDGRAPELVFNGDPGERVEVAITAIEDPLGVQGLGQVLVLELSPLEEKFAEPQDQGRGRGRPHRALAVWQDSRSPARQHRED